MPVIVEFTPEFIPGSIALWRATDHIGLNDYDDQLDPISRFLERNAGCSFVALDQNRVVGACLCGHDSRRGTIYHLAVDGAYRRDGVARSLVQSALNGLAKAGVSKCHAHVFIENPNGEAFWAPTGWQLRDDLNMYSAYTPALR